MDSLTFDRHYSKKTSKRESLYPLFESVFGIPADELQDFYARGFWDPTYRPYTFFDGERAVANASMFTLKLQMDGARVEAAGIQSVMTHPEYRKRGLMRQLLSQMLADIDREYPAAWLFTETPELYTPFGFRTVPQYAYVAEYSHSGSSDGGLRPVHLREERDVQLVRDCFQNHEPISRVFAPVGYESSFFLHMYSPSFERLVHYSERLQAILVYAVKDQTLHLYDIIGKQIPPLFEVGAAIPEPFTKWVLHFPPDRFPELPFEPVVHDSDGKLMVRGPVGHEQSALRMPKTAVF